MLVDTSVWVDFLRGNETKQVHYLEKAIYQQDDLYYCGIVLTEVLQGITDTKQSQSVRSYFDSMLYLEMDRDVYISAANLYAGLRRKGITVRKTLDCLIAALAITSSMPLLHNDKDFLPIEAHCGLKSPFG